MADKILLHIEDSSTEAIIFKRALAVANLPYIVRHVADAAAAIAWLDGKDNFSDRALHPLPDVIVCDLSMPGKNGFEVLEFVRAHRKFDKVPFIIHSNSFHLGYIMKADKLGATEFVVKTASGREIVRCLKKLAEDSAPFRVPVHHSSAMRASL